MKQLLIVTYKSISWELLFSGSTARRAFSGPLIEAYLHGQGIFDLNNRFLPLFFASHRQAEIFLNKWS